jgi:hypothetical protein
LETIRQDDLLFGKILWHYKFWQILLNVCGMFQGEGLGEKSFPLMQTPFSPTGIHQIIGAALGVIVFIDFGKLCPNDVFASDTHNFRTSPFLIVSILSDSKHVVNLL